ncbi:DNA excision repair ERCC-8 isoform X2, putative [Babesia ovata]|uniref:DNA excision repair ERCC-8 isoform X2, putative n=1 Tax=Babesia ovata TaxID=189622 RepID=A0A2H6KEX9_9APIC|nr:DNA excision repair ERCC-8 isoform X2, putative [Babesia ovata]GBE61537.1 DNA excision repair ERCC-8 isoform X2, putative [Babesia ovata]
MIPVFSVAGQRTGIVTRARFSPAPADHRAVSVETEGTITLIDLPSLKYATSNWYAVKAGPFSQATHSPLDFAFSSDGRLMFVADSGGNVSLDAVNDIGNHLSRVHKHLISIESAHDGGVFTIVPSPAYEFLLYTGGGDGMVRLWDLRFMGNGNPMLKFAQGGATEQGAHPASTKPVHEMWAHKNAVSAICFPEKSLMLTAGVDENIRLWDNTQKTVIATIRSYGTALGIWDIAYNRPLDRAVVVGQSTDVWAFHTKDFWGTSEPDQHDMVQIEFEDDDINTVGAFDRWRKPCTHGTSVIIPTLNNRNGAKVLFIDAKTGKESRRVTTDIVDRVHTVDMHPNVYSGLMLTGAAKNACAVATVWMESEPECAKNPEMSRAAPT